MADWKKIGVDTLVGGAAGVADQLVQNLDEHRGLIAAASGVQGAVDKNGKLPMFKQFGTYLNYGVPLATVFGVVTNTVRGDMATRLMTAGAQLAGRKVTHQLSTKATSQVPSAGYTEWARREAGRAAAEAAARSAGYEVTTNKEILV